MYLISKTQAFSVALRDLVVPGSEPGALIPTHVPVKDVKLLVEQTLNFHGAGYRWHYEEAPKL